MKTIALLLISLSLSSQCNIQSTEDTTACNTSNIFLWASGASSYTWQTNGSIAGQISPVSVFAYPYTWSNTITLTAVCCEDCLDTIVKVIHVTFVGCVVGIEENVMNDSKVEYFDLNGNKTEAIENKLLIKQKNNVRSKVYIQAQ